MNAPNQTVTRPAPANGLGRRIAATVLLGGLIFVALWLMALSVITSLLISTGCCVVLVAASTVWDVVEAVLNAIAAVVFGVLAAIAAVFAAIFSLFGS
jgi:hypothetical protein